MKLDLTLRFELQGFPPLMEGRILGYAVDTDSLKSIISAKPYLYCLFNKQVKRRKKTHKSPNEIFYHKIEQ